MWSYILEDDSPAWIRLKRKGRKRRKGNVHAGFSYVKPDGGVERPSSEENESRREDGGSRKEPSHPEVGEEFKNPPWTSLRL